MTTGDTRDAALMEEGQAAVMRLREWYDRDPAEEDDRAAILALIDRQQQALQRAQPWLTLAAICERQQESGHDWGVHISRKKSDFSERIWYFAHTEDHWSHAVKADTLADAIAALVAKLEEASDA